ncbi:mucin-2-like [Argopecten irradians]|uniref:mucin-2-like n=1 Tax=Argopecten irradians TaxID=31199 RepID=UPI00371C38FB
MLVITVLLVSLTLSSAQNNGVCEDVNSLICQDLYKLNPNMCENACYSVALCPRFCGKCPLKCYQCHEVSSPDQCYTTAQCPSFDHFCITSQTFTDDFREVFKLGCAPNFICTSHFGPAIGRREDNIDRRGTLQGSCCDTDLCNIKSRNVSQKSILPAIPVLGDDVVPPVSFDDFVIDIDPTTHKTSPMVATSAQTNTQAPVSTSVPFAKVTSTPITDMPTTLTAARTDTPTAATVTDFGVPTAATDRTYYLSISSVAPGLITDPPNAAWTSTPAVTSGLITERPTTPSAAWTSTPAVTSGLITERPTTPTAAWTSNPIETSGLITERPTTPTAAWTSTPVETSGLITERPTTPNAAWTSTPAVTSGLITERPTTPTAAWTSTSAATSAPVTVAPDCDDVDADICSRLDAASPAMCTVDCIANEVCPRKCGKCMGCYQCSHVPAAETCSHKTICAAGEQCFTVETISATLERGFRMGCLNEKLCSSFGEAAPNIFGKRQAFELSLRGGCCKGDYCNHHALLPTTTMAPTTTTTPTITTPPPPTTTTQQPTTHNPDYNCPSRHTKCPTGWIPYHSSCYALSVTPKSWADAKATCERLCSNLADFSSSADLLSVIADVGKKVNAQVGRLRSTIAWVDGQVTNYHWVLGNGQGVDSSLTHNLRRSDNSECGSINIGTWTLSQHTAISQYLEPLDCHTQHMPLCEIEHVYS